MSPNEANFDLWERCPLSRNILQASEVTTHKYTGQRPNPGVKGYRGWLLSATSPKAATGYLGYPVTGRDTAKSGKGCTGIAI